jgi:hypothetical protein
MSATPVTPSRSRRLSGPATGLLLVAGAALAGACSVEVNLGGETVTETYSVGDFEQVSIDGAFDVVVEFGPESVVEVDIDEQLVDRLDVDVDGDTLRIDLTNGLSLNKGDIDVRITTPQLVALTTGGATSVDVVDLETDSFELRTSGAADVEMTGTVDTIDVTADGAASIDLGGLTATTASIDLSGATDLDISGAETVSGDARGAATIDVGDDADHQITTSGAASIN